MPYRDRVRDREWHRDYMRQKRSVTPYVRGHVTPDVTPHTHTTESHYEFDVDGNPIYDD